MFVLNYSFFFRYQPEHVFSVNVPLERLAGADLSVSVVRNLVEGDPELLSKMLSFYEAEYRRQNQVPGYWAKDLERMSEGIRIMTVHP